MAGRSKVRDLGPVAFEGLAIAVELEAVELDDEVELRPMAVDEVAVDENVDLRLGQASTAQQVEIQPLELRQGVGGRRWVIVEEGAQARRATVAGAAAKELPDRG